MVKTIFGAVSAGIMFPALLDKAYIMCTAKLEQTFLISFIRAIFCGLLMYTAAEIFKEKKTPLGIIFCIPVFILCGFEHSIADMFYFGASGIFEARIITFELAAVLGNTVGGLLLPVFSKISAENK